MRFNSRGTKAAAAAAAAAELPTAHISHLQQGSGPRLSRRRARAFSFRRIHPSAVDFCASGRVRARVRAPAVGRLRTFTAVRLEALSGREVMKGHTSNILFSFLFTRNQNGGKKAFVSVWTCFGQFCAYNDEPQTVPRTLLEVEEDDRAGRPLTGRVKDGDGETLPPDAQLREREKETR